MGNLKLGSAILVLVSLFVKQSQQLPTSSLNETLHAHPLGVVPELGVKNCGGSGRVLSVEATGCNTNPCFFQPGQRVTLKVTIENPDATITLVSRGWYHDLLGTKIDFWDTPHSGVVMPGEIISFENSTIIPASMAAVRGFITLQVWDNSFGHPTACADFEALVSL